MNRSLSRKDNHRKSLLRNLSTSLILYEEIRTTKAKALEVKPIVEHLIQVAKKETLQSRRRLLGYFFDKNAAKKVIEVLVPRYKKIQSGFVKIYHLGPRLGDSAEMVILKLTPKKIVEEKDAEEKKPTEGSVKETAKKEIRKASAKTKK